MNSIFSFILVLGVLIFVHEFGHFIVAKLFRIRVLKFSLGFGPTIFSKQYGETEYILSALPLGGYVKMFGEQPDEEISPKEQLRSFSHKAVWQRFLVVLAGPLFNLISAVLIFFMVYSISGIPHPLPGTEIGQVTKGSPAEQYGIHPGDIILAIDGTKMESWQNISETVRNSGGEKMFISIQREEQRLEISAQPQKSDIKNIFGEVSGSRYLLGISKKEEYTYKKTTMLQAFMAGAEQTWFYIYITVMSVVKIFQNVIPTSELGGPILIAQMAGKQFEAGWLNLFSFMGVLSVNLGIINLFPIPILDGGHLFFFSIEAIRRKPLSLQSQNVLQKIGIGLLASLMILVFYNDVVRLFTKG